MASFYERVAQFKKENPRPPVSKTDRKPSDLLSLNNWMNLALVKSVAINCLKSDVIKELTLCGMHMSLKACEFLNRGLLTCKSMDMLRINFCI